MMNNQKYNIYMYIIFIFEFLNLLEIVQIYNIVYFFTIFKTT